MLEAQEKKTGNGDPESALQGAGDFFGSILGSVSGGITKAAGGKIGAVPLETITEVVQSAVRGAVGVGNNLVMGAKAVVVGVLRGTGEREEAALTTLSHTARTVIREAAVLSTDLAACTKGLILGAIASAKDMGVDRGRAASAAARGALDGSQDAGSVEVDKVRATLRAPIGGVTVGIPEPVKK